MNRDKLYPCLVVGNDGNASGLSIGHGLVAHLWEMIDATPIMIDHDQLREAKLSFEEAYHLALDNLIRFADESPELSIQVLGKPGDAVHFLLYSDHPLASSCLLLPDLFDQACEELQMTELCACVPQQESLVIFPKGNRLDRDRIVGQLRAIEADADHPLSFELFELSPRGVKEFQETNEAG